MKIGFSFVRGRYRPRLFPAVAFRPSPPGRRDPRCRPADPGHHQRRHQHRLSRSGGTRADHDSGGNTVPGTWTAANGQLCLSNGAAQECWPYSGAVPGRAAGDADQLVQRDVDLARPGDQHAAAAGPRGERGQLSRTSFRASVAAVLRARPRTVRAAPRATASWVRSRWSGVTET